MASLETHNLMPAGKGTVNYIKTTHRLIAFSVSSEWYTIKGVSADSWIMANVNATGFFMVNYDQENWRKLAAQLRIDHQVDVYRIQYVSFSTVLTLSTENSQKSKTLENEQYLMKVLLGSLHLNGHS